MKNRSRRMAYRDPRPARTPSSRKQRSSISLVFHEEVVQVTYVTDFTHHEEQPPEIIISGAGFVAALQPVVAAMQPVR